MVTTGVLTNSVTGYNANANNLRLLNSSGGNRAYDGYVDDLRLFNDIQTVGQMQALVVPEPATWALLAGGMTILTVLRRRRA